MDTIIETANNFTLTSNGAMAYDSTNSALLDHFSTVVARDQKHGSAMINERIIELTENAREENKDLFPRLVAHLRDCRGGKGEKHASMVVWNWWLTNYPDEALPMLKNIPFYGCYGDLVKWFLESPYYYNALDVVSDALDNDRTVLLKVKSILKISSVLDLDLSTVDLEFKDKVSELCTGLTLAAKWAPRENRSLDKKAKKLSIVPPSFVLMKNLGITNRSDYRKLLVELTYLLDVPEVKMCKKRFDLIDYSKVPSKALMIYGKKAFPKHDRIRYSDWLTQATLGKVKANTSQVEPYEIIKKILESYYCLDQELYQMFYDKQVEELKANNTSVLVVADVSGSMKGVPLYVSISLALWLSNASSGPWHNKFLTFESSPRLIEYAENTSLYQRVHIVNEAPWGGSTNLLATAEVIVKCAKSNSEYSMPEKLIIVSDMEFDLACCNGCNKLPLEQYRKVFIEAGYVPPTIVFWNVSGKFNGYAQPASKDMNGVIMLSGFSKDLFYIILNKEKIPNPYDTMVETLMNSRYDRMCH